MPIQFQCPHCGLELTVEDRFAGQTGPCRGCGQPVTISAGESSTVAPVILAAQPLVEGGVSVVPQAMPAKPALAHPLPTAPTHSGPGEVCPKCQSDNVGKGPWPWYLGTIGAVFVRARICHGCQHEFDLKKPHADFAKRKRNLALIINGFGLLGILIVVGLLGFLVYRTF